MNFSLTFLAVFPLCGHAFCFRVALLGGAAWAGEPGLGGSGRGVLGPETLVGLRVSGKGGVWAWVGVGG